MPSPLLVCESLIKEQKRVFRCCEYVAVILLGVVRREDGCGRDDGIVVGDALQYLHRRHVDECVSFMSPIRSEEVGKK